MIVQREITLDCPPQEVWERVKTSALLKHICLPLVTFEPADGPDLPEQWKEGARVRLSMALLTIIPLGVRKIDFIRVDDACMTIQTHEHDALIRQWNHTIRVQHGENRDTHYLDRIEIDAGVLTIPVYIFAQLFFMYRHMRWKGVARRITKEKAAAA